MKTSTLWFWVIAIVIALLVVFPIIKTLWIAAFWLAQFIVAVLITAFIIWLARYMWRRSQVNSPDRKG